MRKYKQPDTETKKHYLEGDWFQSLKVTPDVGSTSCSAKNLQLKGQQKRESDTPEEETAEKENMAMNK